jgi:DNA-binding GntR family transcriptional regulator
MNSSDLSITRETTVERVADVLRRRILDGGFPPGTPLIELDVAGTVGVSRGSVRHAFSLLIAEGLLTRDSYRSVVVTRSDENDIREIFQARRLLELAATDAAAHATADELAEMDRASAAFVAAVEAGDITGTHEADVEVHAALVALLHSGRLSRLHLSLMGELRLALSATYEASLDAEDLVPRHQEFMDLLRAGKTAEARAQLERRLDEAERRMLGLFHTDA